METDPRPIGDSPADRPALVAETLIVIAAWVAYANSFHVPFLLDDFQAITENSSIKALGQLGKVLSPDPATTADRPLLNLTFAVNYAWSGDRVWSYHLVNLGVHILAALTLFGIVRRTLESQERSRIRKYQARSATAGHAYQNRTLTSSATPFAFAIALLWTVHPLQTEAVTYISQRAESLMGLFYLLTLFCFIRSTTSPRAAAWQCFSVVACFCGMATKEPMVTAPLLVVLYDRAFLSDSFREAAVRRRWYYLGLCSAWLILGYLMAGGSLDRASVGFHSGIDWRSYALTEFKVVAEYVKLSLWPHPLVFDYGKEMSATSIRQAAPYTTFVLVLAIAAATAWRFSKPLGFVAASFFILLSPTSSVVPVATQPMAENRMYLPLAAVLTVVGLAGYAWGGRKALAVLVVAAIALGALTFRRNHLYSSPVNLWEDTVAKQPGSLRGQFNLATLLASIPDRAPEALAHFELYERIRRIHPDTNAAAHNDLGIAFNRNEWLAEATAQFQEALRLQPNFPEARLNLARLQSAR